MEQFIVFPVRRHLVFVLCVSLTMIYLCFFSCMMARNWFMIEKYGIDMYRRKQRVVIMYIHVE